MVEILKTALEIRQKKTKQCTSPPQVFISNGWMADVVVVVAVTNPEAKTSAHGISLFLVENGMKGFHKGRKLEKIGLKAQVPELAGSIYLRPSGKGRLSLLTVLFGVVFFFVLLSGHG